METNKTGSGTAWDIFRHAIPGSIVVVITAVAALFAWNQFSTPPVPWWLIVIVVVCAIVATPLASAARASLSVLDPRVQRVNLSANLTVYSALEEGTELAICARFENAPGMFHWRLSEHQDVFARLKFVSRDGEVIEAGPACWLDSASPVVRFRPGETRCLILAARPLSPESERFTIPLMPAEAASEPHELSHPLDAGIESRIIRRIGPLQTGEYVCTATISAGDYTFTQQYRVSILPEMARAQRGGAKR